MANPSRRLVLLSLACVAATALVACQESPPTAPADLSVDLTDGYIGYETGTCDHSLHNQLEEWFEVPGAMWHSYTAVFDCSDGVTNVFEFAPAGWDPERTLLLSVPDAVVPTNAPGYPHVAFTIMVPLPSGAIPINGDPPPPWTAIPFRFLPDLDFDGTVFFKAYWPSFAAPPPEDNAFDFVDIGALWREDSQHYRVERISSAYYAAEGSPAPPAPSPWTSDIGFHMEHFSRWTLVDGDGGGGGGVLEALGVSETESCWTDNPVDPLEPARPLR